MEDLDYLDMPPLQEGPNEGVEDDMSVVDVPDDQAFINLPCSLVNNSSDEEEETPLRLVEGVNSRPEAGEQTRPEQHRGH